MLVAHVCSQLQQAENSFQGMLNKTLEAFGLLVQTVRIVQGRCMPLLMSQV